MITQWLFYDRKKEIKLLEKYRSWRKKGKNIIPLIYGLRRVGKSILVSKFAEKYPSIKIDCGSLATAILNLPKFSEIRASNEFDIIAESESLVLLCEIKLGNLSRHDVSNFLTKVRKFATKKQKLPLMICIGTPLPGALVTAAKNNIIIASKEFVKFIARKAKMPFFF